MAKTPGSARASRYKENAARLREMAQGFRHFELARQLLTMAEQYERLARQVEDGSLSG